MKDFRDLKVWEKAHQLVKGLYQATGHFPTEEKFGLTAQMRRAAVSIPANIAEGCGRGSGAYSSHRERRIQSKLNSESGGAERSSKR